MRRKLLARAAGGILAILAAAPPLAAAESMPQPGGVALLDLPPPAGPSRLLRPLTPTQPPFATVVLLPDASGADGRAEPYIDLLLDAGLMVLELSLDGPATPEAVAAGLAALPEIDGSRLGLLGFGAGGRTALAAAAGQPAVALYPGCGGLDPLPPQGLVLHPAAEDCAGAARDGGRAIRLSGARHGWDLTAVPRMPRAPSLLPDPAGEGRIAAHPDPEVTRQAARIVARVFAPLLWGGGR